MKLCALNVGSLELAFWNT